MGPGPPAAALANASAVAAAAAVCAAPGMPCAAGAPPPAFATFAGAASSCWKSNKCCNNCGNEAVKENLNDKNCSFVFGSKQMSNPWALAVKPTSTLPTVIMVASIAPRGCPLRRRDYEGWKSQPA